MRKYLWERFIDGGMHLGDEVAGTRNIGRHMAVRQQHKWRHISNPSPHID